METIKFITKILIFTDKHAPYFANLIRRIKPKIKKEQLQILFIDDETMPIVETLRKAGYQVKKKQNISSEDDVDVRNSHVVFVDYDGVGGKLSDQQGAGVIKRIRNKYQKTKYLILYTAQPTYPAETITRGFIDYADAKMRKGASMDEFIDQLDKAISKL
ncbi:hypothetical protein HOB87_13110 [Candidatus Woesearchaeota archaeon]|nr:hypothetical protein [Candidatus Woesearchaeota archaeon]